MIEDDAVLFSDETPVGAVPEREVQLSRLFRCAWTSYECLDVEKEVMERPRAALWSLTSFRCGQRERSGKLSCGDRFDGRYERGAAAKERVEWYQIDVCELQISNEAVIR